jgi:predicted small lipoprotein YifL
MRVIVLAAVVLLPAALGACGQTGPLYHPPSGQQDAANAADHPAPAEPAG